MRIPIKVYLAARYSRNAEMREVRDILASFGMEVTSRWIDLHPDIVGNHEESKGEDALNRAPKECAPLAMHDLDDLARSNWVINFTGQGGRRGGRHVEFGYALATGKRLFVVGPREHVFHTLPAVEHLPDTASLVQWLITDTFHRFPAMTLDQIADITPGAHRLGGTS